MFGCEGFKYRGGVVRIVSGRLSFGAEVGYLLHPVGNLFHFWKTESAGGNGRSAEADARRAKSGSLVVR